MKQYVYATGTKTKMPQELAKIFMQRWLMENHFIEKIDDKGSYYESKDMYLGNRYIEYRIENEIVTVYASIGTRKNQQNLSGFLNLFEKELFKRDLEKLFFCFENYEKNMKECEIKDISFENFPYRVPISNAHIKNLHKELDKRNSYLTFLSLAIAILVFMSVLNIFTINSKITTDFVLMLLGLCCAMYGLKSTKRILAIASIVLIAIAFVLLLIFLFI